MLSQILSVAEETQTSAEAAEPTDGITGAIEQEVSPDRFAIRQAAAGTAQDIACVQCTSYTHGKGKKEKKYVELGHEVIHTYTLVRTKGSIRSSRRRTSHIEMFDKMLPCIQDGVALGTLVPASEVSGGI